MKKTKKTFLNDIFLLTLTAGIDLVGEWEQPVDGSDIANARARALLFALSDRRCTTQISIRCRCMYSGMVGDERMMIRR